MSDQLTSRQQDEEIERKQQKEKLKLQLETLQQREKELKKKLKQIEEQKHNENKEQESVQQKEVKKEERRPRKTEDQISLQQQEKQRQEEDKKRKEEEERKRKQEEVERQQQETEEEKRKRIEREVRKLEEKLNLQVLPQRQQPKNISELTGEHHDQLLLFKIYNDEDLKVKFCTRLPIVNILSIIGSHVSQKLKSKIKETESNLGNYQATEMFLSFATNKKLITGWSKRLLQLLQAMKLEDMEELISLKQADLDDFINRNGIPRGRLLDRIRAKQSTKCGLVDPMGRDDDDKDECKPAPIRHPQLCVSEDHFTKNTAFTDGTYKPSEEGRKAYKYAPRISFNDVTKPTAQIPESAFSALLRKHHRLSLFFIGPAGCGKTTITKRMAKTWIEDHKMAFLIPFAPIVKTERQSLKNLLTNFVCQLHDLKNPSKEEIDESFQWVLDNQDKLLLIFDGLDQSGFVISKHPIENPDINDEFLPGDLVSLLLSRKFLPDCRLIIASRPHTMTQFAPAIQPQIVVFLNDLLREDVEVLMNHYLQQQNAKEIMEKLRINSPQQNAEEIMEKLRINSPRIHQLVFNPLFLRLVVMLNKVMNKDEGVDVWSYVNTTAKLFFEVIKKLQFSAHQESDGIDVEVLNNKLGEMAFEKTMEGSVVFTQEDLKLHGLDGKKTQDFLFGIMKGSTSKKGSCSNNTALLVGLTEDRLVVMIFFFNHQSTQEFFSARFAVEELAVDEFKNFVKKLFPRLEKNEGGEMVGVGADPFAILRVLVIGCFNELREHHELRELRELCENKSLKQDERDILMKTITKLMKRDIFIGYLKDHLQLLFAKVARTRTVKEHQEQIFGDLLDFREERIVTKIRQELKDVNFTFNSQLQTSALQEGFSHFIQNFITKVDKMWLDIRKWNNESIKRLFQAIKDSSTKIGIMEIWMKPQQHEYTKDIVETFSHFTTILKLELFGEFDTRLFCEKLKESIIQNFDSSNPPRQDLTVDVQNDSIAMKVELRSGKPPQFIKEDL